MVELKGFETPSPANQSNGSKPLRQNTNIIPAFINTSQLNLQTCHEASENKTPYNGTASIVQARNAEKTLNQHSVNTISI
jgi:hypothetical protein